MKIGKLQTNYNIFLAPMAGVNDVGFRAIASFFGAEITFSEMVSAKGLVLGNKKIPSAIFSKKFCENNKELCLNKSASLLLTEPIENLKAIQLFGDDPKFFQEALKLKCLEKYDIIDLNMGCPAPKIIRNFEGSALMKNLPLAQKIIQACVQATNKPVTVKFRKGFKIDNCEEFAKMCEEAGASAITIHGRLTTQGYSGCVDYDAIKKVKNSVKIPVIGSGDIRNFDTLKKMMETGVDGVMIGRASQGNLEIFKQLNDFLYGKKQKMEKFILKNNFFENVLTEEDLSYLKKDERYVKFICAKKHVEILRKYFQENFVIKYMRKHFLWYCSSFKSQDKKILIARSNSIEQSLSLLKEIIIENLF